MPDALPRYSLEDFQKLSILEGFTFRVVQHPAVEDFYIESTSTYRKLGPSPQGSALTTRETVVLDLECAQAVVRQMADHISRAERLRSRG